MKTLRDWTKENIKIKQFIYRLEDDEILKELHYNDSLFESSFGKKIILIQLLISLINK